MKTHSNLPRVFNKTWLKELRKALEHPSFKVTALPPEIINLSYLRPEERKIYKQGIKLIRKHYGHR